MPRLLLVIGLLFLTPTASAQTPDFQWPRDSSLIDHMFAKYQGNVPGASLLVVKNGEVLYAKGYGLANPETGEKATPQTNYRLASVSKQFTGMAIMMLVQQGKLKYENTLTEIFPDFPAYGKHITVKHLLTHRCGLRDYFAQIPKGRTKQLTDREVLEMMKQQRSGLFPPGTKYEYSNSGYAVLAEIVAKVSGMSFADFVEREIFQTLGMRTATVFEPDDRIPHRAYGHVATPSRFVLNDQSLTSAVQGDGGIYMSLEDYALWDKALRNHTLLPDSSMQDGIVAWDENGRTDTAGYGFGWRIDYLNGHKLWYHSGVSRGFRNHSLRIPSEDLTVVVLSNRNKTVQHLAEGVASLFCEEAMLPQVQTAMYPLANQGKLDSALALLRHSAADSDSLWRLSASGLCGLARDLQEVQRTKDAIRVYRECLSIFPESHEAWAGLADCHEENHSSKEGIHCYKQAMRFVPEEEGRLRRTYQRALRKLTQD